MMATAAARFPSNSATHSIGGVGVVDVVVGELLALHLPRGGDAEALLGRAIERRALVRVLAVAQRLGELAAERAKRRRGIVERLREPVGDRGVVRGGAGVGLGGELLAQRQRGRAAVLGELGEHGGVVVGLDHHRDVGVVLGGGADHRRAADVDVLDAIVVGRALRHGGLERIEIHHHEIDRLDAVCGHRAGVVLVGADGEQAAMHPGMQRLDAAVHHLGEAGELRNVDHLEAGVFQRLGGAAGRNQLDAVAGERLGEFGEAGLVGHREQRAGDFAKLGHLTLTACSTAVRAIRRGRALCRRWPASRRRSSNARAALCGRGRR